MKAWQQAELGAMPFSYLSPSFVLVQTNNPVCGGEVFTLMKYFGKIIVNAIFYQNIINK